MEINNLKGYRSLSNAKIILKFLPLLFYLLLRGYGASFSAATPHVIDDTGVYTAMGSAPLFSETMLAGLRPPVVPLFYKLFNNNFHSIILFQSIVSMVSWLFLATTASLYIKNRIIRIATFLLINGIGMSKPVAVWEGCLNSESISISLSVFFMATILSFIRSPTGFRLAVLTCVTVLLMFCRESNAWVLFVLAMVGGGVSFVVKDRRYLVWSGVVVVTFLVNTWTSNIGRRWIFPELNVLSQRILTQPQRTAGFTAAGMPVSNELMNMKGKWASSDNQAYYRSPDLHEFREWFFRYGKKTYIGWLLLHPATALVEPLENIRPMVAPGILLGYGARINSSLLPHGLGRLFFPIGYKNNFSILVVWVLVFCTGIAIGVKAWRKNSLWIFGIVMVLLAYPHLFIVWHADAMEVERHAMGIRVQLNIAWWIMAMLFAEYCSERFQKIKLFNVENDVPVVQEAHGMKETASGNIL